jgi:hypothetical protein
MSLQPGLAAAPGLDTAALKAVRTSLPGKLLGRTSAILASVALVLGFAELANTSMAHLGLVLSPPWLNQTLLIGVPALVIAVQLLNEWRAERNRRMASILAIKPSAVPDDYFRIGPYLDTDKDRNSFTRADKAHEKVLWWLRQSTSMPLYLTGDSGSGKSSLLNTFVLPALRKDGWTVIPVRASQDAEAALTAALTPPRRTRTSAVRELIEAAVRRYDDRLILVLDQFEEFIILSVPQKQQAIAATFANLAERPIKGLKILLVIRSDYQTALDEMGLPRLLQGQNFLQIGRFREEAARAFLKGSRLSLKDEPLARLLKSAAELDDTPGMVRPITLNVLGYILLLQGGAVAPSLDAGKLVRDYIAQTVENPAIRAWSPSVLEELLTEQGTKRMRRETELATETRLRPAEVRAVLHVLSDAALARPLEANEDAWELSHDFVARAVGRYLGRRRGDLWRRIGAYAAPALLTFAVMVGLAAVEWNYLAPNQGLMISNQVSKGFEQLASDKVVVRLGGIYALEGAMNTSMEYHQPVLEALCAFVRDSTIGKIVGKEPTTEIQAVLSTIGRRADGPGHVNLSNAQLSGANLIAANLRGADLSGVHLSDANLGDAKLTSARLNGADLRGANLRGADLRGADLDGVNLSDANLRDAIVSDAYLHDAQLSGADLRGIDLGQAQLDAACGTAAVLPGGLVMRSCP